MSRRRKDEDIENVYYQKLVDDFIKESIELCVDIELLHEMRSLKMEPEIRFMIDYFQKHRYLETPEDIAMLYEVDRRFNLENTDRKVTNVFDKTIECFQRFYDALNRQDAPDLLTALLA